MQLQPDRHHHLRPLTSRNTLRGFTLIELLVVIGILGLLLAILLPMVNNVRKQAYAVSCLSNQRQLMAATRAYSDHFDGFLPYSGWGNITGLNWLYDFAKTPTFAQNSCTTGALWPYLRDIGSFRCPLDTGPWASGSIQDSTSYVMNGAVNSYTNMSKNTWQPWQRLSQFKSDDILFWEIPLFATGAKISTNDPTNFPPEAVTTRHFKGTTVGCFDGHAEIVNDDDFNIWCQTGPTRLWCDPALDQKTKIFDGGIGYWSYGPIPNPIQMFF